MNSETVENAGAELHRVRAELETTRRQYLALCNAAMSHAQIIYGKAANDHAPEAAELTAELLQFLSTRKHQFTMRQEQAGSTAGAYDLAALRVDAGQASDSETGYEDRG